MNDWIVPWNGKIEPLLFWGGQVMYVIMPSTPDGYYVEDRAWMMVR